MTTDPAKAARIRIPPKLDTFIKVDFDTLQYVVDHAQITIVFDTPSQAQNTKFRLMRLRDALLRYEPENPLGLASKTFIFKMRKEKLTIVDRERSLEAHAQRQALAGHVEDVSSDPNDWRLPINLKLGE